jgi:hypothetical protein
LYRESAAAVNRNKEESSILGKLILGMFLLVYFTLMPIACTWGVNWVVYWVTADNLYSEAWMMPALLLFGTFLGGVFIRQKIEDDNGGMALFFLGMVALIIFSILTHMDIEKVGGIYSQFMPKLLRPSIASYIYMLPGVGLIGMMFYKFFTIKHYS